MAVDSGTYDPETVARHQAIAATLLKQATAPREIRSRLQGAGQLGEGLLAGLQSGWADKEAKDSRAEAVAQALQAFGGGGQQPAPAALPTPAAAPVGATGAQPQTADAGPSIVPIGSSQAASAVPSGQYQPIIDKSAVANGVNPETMARLLNQESGFNPNATSPAGAQGIAQFMPATAKQYGVNPNDPNSAIPGASKYLGDLTKQFGGNEGLALAAYNWGPGNVQKWVSGGADPAKVPVETQKYVKAITGRPLETSARVAGALNPGGGGGEPQPAPQNAPAGPAGDQPATPNREAIVRALMNPWTPPGVASALSSQMNPSYGFQTLPDGTILRTDPKSGQVTPIYREPAKPTWGIIGETADGGKQYGWIHANSQGAGGPRVEPYNPTGSSNTPTPIMGADGKPIAVPPGVDPKEFRKRVTESVADAAAGKKTEVQAKDEKFANKMELAEKNLTGLEGEGQSVKGRALEGSSYIPGSAMLGNKLQTDNYQKYKQARDNFITALLRDESGAAIGSSEFDRYEKELFPQPGDGKAVVDQKREARRIATEGMKKGAGPGYKGPTAEPTAGEAPSGVESKVWAAMTPSERALWK